MITFICVYWIPIFLEAKRRNDDLFFLIKFGDVQNVEEVLACDANELWPQMVIQFYEKRLKWIAPAAQQSNANVDTNPIEDANIDENEEPEAVLCTWLFIFFILSSYLCVN